MVQVTGLFHPDELLLGLSKRKRAPRQNRSLGTTLGNFDRRLPKLSSRVTIATSGDGVVCPIYIYNYTGRYIFIIHNIFILLIVSVFDCIGFI